MKKLPRHKAFTLLEPGPVVLVTTHDGQQSNIMTISWTMVVDFTPVFAITTGSWNHSFAALRKTKECVIAIPTVDLLDKVVGVGTCSGSDVDKFEKFKLTPLKASKVKAPLIKECLANIECQVIDNYKKHSIVILQGVAAWVDAARKERRTLHAVGDGTFVADGRKLDRRKMMRSKIPAGVCPSGKAGRCASHLHGGFFLPIISAPPMRSPATISPMTQALTMHPRDFEVNQTWLAFRVNQRPILAGGQELDLFVLQDAASMFIFGNAFALHEDEAPSEEEVSKLLHAAWARQNTWPSELVLAGKPSKSNIFTVVARQLDIHVRSAPEAQMSLYIKDVQKSLEGFLGRDAEREA